MAKAKHNGLCALLRISTLHGTRCRSRSHCTFRLVLPVVVRGCLNPRRAAHGGAVAVGRVSGDASGERPLSAPVRTGHEL